MGGVMRNVKQRLIGNWKGRSLQSYRARNKKRAEEMGVLDKLLKVTTLTKARKLMGGINE